LSAEAFPCEFAAGLSPDVKRQRGEGPEAPDKTPGPADGAKGQVWNRSSLFPQPRPMNLEPRPSRKKRASSKLRLRNLFEDKELLPLPGIKGKQSRGLSNKRTAALPVWSFRPLRGEGQSSSASRLTTHHSLLTTHYSPLTTHYPQSHFHSGSFAAVVNITIPFTILIVIRYILW
jgi:hypothetical protein